MAAAYPIERAMKLSGVRFASGSRLGTRRGRATHVASGPPPAEDCAVALLTDAGLTGVSIAPQAVRTLIEALTRDLLVGEDPRGVTGLWQRMQDAQSARRCDGPIQAAMAALDVALWDLKGKINGEPLWKALGGSRPRARAHAAGINVAADDADLHAWCERMSGEFGLHGATLRASLEPATDLRRLDLVRSLLLKASPEPVLVVDIDRRCTPKQTIRFVRAIEQKLDIAWVEGAARDWDFPGLKQVSDAIGCAVAVGRGLATPGEFLPHFHHRSADVIQIDIGVTGITGALQLADAAYGYELPVMLVAAPGNMHAHLAAVMPYFMSVEVVDPAPESPLYSTGVRIEQGCAVAGHEPGHGLTVRGLRGLAASAETAPRGSSA
jgi:L-alanine-DL-glutamate epimerase-like enolase superfamily enzyme